MERIAPSPLHVALAPWRYRRSKLPIAPPTWLAVCADYYNAAAFYEQLARLSDAELQRRGLTRDTLAGDICAACDRGGPRSRT